MSNNIVTVNVSQTQAPTASKLQRNGAFVSQGATNLSAGASALLVGLSSLTTLLNGASAITSLTPSVTSSGGDIFSIVTAVTTSGHGYTTGEVILLTIAGASPASANGTFQCTITGSTGFTYLGGPGGGSITGTIVYTAEDVGELLADVTTFFAQGATVPVSVLELGKGNATDGATYLTAWLTANPGVFYGFFVPDAWDGNSTFLTLIASYEGLSAKTYFWVTTTIQNYALYTALMKDVVAMVEAPAYGTWAANAITAAVWYSASNEIVFTTTTAHGVVAGQWFQISGMTPSTYNGWFLADADTGGSVLRTLVYTNPGSETVLGTLVASTYASTGAPATEQSLAAAFFTTLNYNPSGTNKVTPLAFSYQYGVTPFPPAGNASLLATFKSIGTNFIDTGSEGGISNTILKWGTTMDTRPFNYWYSVDWAQINCQLALANEIINGSNNPINPLYLNQDGINRLQARLADTMGQAVTYGLALGNIIQTELDGPVFAQNLEAGLYAGNVVVNAIPFVNYYSPTENPNDYKIGTYNGLSVVYTPLRGFESVTVNLNITDFVA